MRLPKQKRTHTHTHRPHMHFALLLKLDHSLIIFRVKGLWIMQTRLKIKTYIIFIYILNTSPYAFFCCSLINKNSSDLCMIVILDIRKKRANQIWLPHWSSNFGEIFSSQSISPSYDATTQHSSRSPRDKHFTSAKAYRHCTIVHYKHISKSTMRR